MASKSKIASMLGAIRELYPTYNDNKNPEKLTALWCSLLEPYPDNVVSEALKRCMTLMNKTPTPADVIEQIKLITEPDIGTTWSEYLNVLEKAYRIMGRFNYTAIDKNGLTQGENARIEFDRLYDELNEVIKAFVPSKGELMRCARLLDDSEGLRWERTRFERCIQEHNTRTTLLIRNNDTIKQAAIKDKSQQQIRQII